MLIEFQHKRFNGSSLEIIEQANAIIAAYEQEGYDLTLRQLYYQFVARGLLANKQANYDRLGRIISEARLAGLVDWDRIQDRTRKPNVPTHWSGPAEIVRAAANGYHIDLWQGQSHYLEVWVEKDALIDVVQRAASGLDVTCFSCRGYTSQSAMFKAAKRIMRQAGKDRNVVVVHLGDHDPSGIDMTRDIQERLDLFLGHYGYGATVERVALSMDQVEQYGCPPNPAKLTDSRAPEYVAQYGYDSWELDALPPTAIAELIEGAVAKYLDEEMYNQRVALKEQQRAQLVAVAERFEQEQEDGS